MLTFPVIQKNDLDISSVKNFAELWNKIEEVANKPGLSIDSWIEWRIEENNQYESLLRHVSDLMPGSTRTSCLVGLAKNVLDPTKWSNYSAEQKEHLKKDFHFIITLEIVAVSINSPSTPEGKTSVCLNELVGNFIEREGRDNVDEKMKELATTHNGKKLRFIENIYTKYQTDRQQREFESELPKAPSSTRDDWL